MTYGTIVLYNRPWITNIETYKHAYKIVPQEFRIYYLVSSAFYTNEFIAVFLEPHKKDFLEMVTHHVATLVLIGLSYKYNLIRFGVLILCLHDWADPFLEFAKVNVILGNPQVANVLFFLFMIIFIISRNFIYPIFLVYPAVKHLCLLPPMWWSYTIGVMLNVLVVLHVIWTMFIIQMAYRLILYKEQKDTRSQESGM